MILNIKGNTKSTSLLHLKKGLTHLLFVLTFLAFGNAFSQYTIPPKPKKTSEQTSVYDYYKLLSSGQKQTLENKLIKYSDTTSTQIVVAIIPSTKGEYINYLGAQWAQKWGIGDKDKDNGIFILLAQDDRKIGINTGYGTEHLMTDAISRRIIEQDILPYFRQNNYYGGLNRGTDAIFEVLKGEYQGTRQEATIEEFPIELLFFLFFIFIFILIAFSKKRRGGNGTDRKSVV